MNIKGRHWVFIIGFIVSAIVGTYSPQLAGDILFLLFLIGVGISMNY